MSLPPSPIKVGHLQIDVVPLTEEEADKHDIDGDADTHRQSLRLRETLKPALMVETALHEIMHVCYDVWKINARWGEERTVDSLASGLTTVFKDNPKFVEWMVKNLHTP